MGRARHLVLSMVAAGVLGVVAVAAAAPVTDHFAALDAELATLQAELEASSDPIEQKEARLVAKARSVLGLASDGLRGDARLAQKLLGKLEKALGDGLVTPLLESLPDVVEAALVGLADDIVAQIDAADVAADSLPEGERTTVKALKALDKALASLAGLAAVDGPTLEHAQAIFKAASALVKAQLKIVRAGADPALRNFLEIDVVGGERYVATQASVRFVESTQTLEVKTSSLRSSGERHVLEFDCPGVGGAGVYEPSDVLYAESETALFGASAPMLDAECGIGAFDPAGGIAQGYFTVTDLPAVGGGETRTLSGGGFDFQDVEVVP